MRTAQISPAAILSSAACSDSELIDEAELSLRTMLPADWSVDAFASCDGTRSLVIMDLSDDAPATYVVSEATTGLELIELRDDTLRPVAACRTLRQLGFILNTCILADRPSSRRAA